MVAPAILNQSIQELIGLAKDFFDLLTRNSNMHYENAMSATDLFTRN